MADLEQLKQKYAPVIETMQGFAEYGATLDEPELDGEQLHLKGTVPSTVIANRVWDVIKEVDPAFSDLHHEIATTGGETQPYTIKAGDTLSHVSKVFYGSPNHYMLIVKENSLPDPNNVPIGTTLQVPVRS
jgi:nucleoid-associated protein YgaU